MKISLSAFILESSFEWVENARLEIIFPQHFNNIVHSLILLTLLLRIGCNFNVWYFLSNLFFPFHEHFGKFYSSSFSWNLMTCIGVGFCLFTASGILSHLLVKKIHALQFWETFIISLIIPIFPFVSKNWALLPEYRRDGLLAIWGTESIRDLNSLHVDFQPTFLFLCAFNSWAFLGKVILVGLFLLSFPQWNITEQEKFKPKAVTPHSSAFCFL